MSRSLTISLQSVAFFLLISIPGFASSPSWMQQPSWASGGQESGSERRPLREARYQVSPFAPGSNNLALDVGQVFLMGDLGEYSDSIGSQLHYTYGVSELFGFDSSVGYSEHSDGKFSMLTMLAGLRTNLSWYDRVVPYVVFGLGFYRPSYELDGSQTSNGNAPSLSPVLFGVHLGPGVNLELTRQLFFGASLTFHDVFGGMRTTSSGDKIEVGGTFTSFLLHAGVTF